MECITIRRDNKVVGLFMEDKRYIVLVSIDNKVVCGCNTKDLQTAKNYFNNKAK